MDRITYYRLLMVSKDPITLIKSKSIYADPIKIDLTRLLKKEGE